MLAADADGSCTEADGCGCCESECGDGDENAHAGNGASWFGWKAAEVAGGI